MSQSMPDEHSTPTYIYFDLIYSTTFPILLPLDPSSKALSHILLVRSGPYYIYTICVTSV